MTELNQATATVHIVLYVQQRVADIKILPAFTLVIIQAMFVLIAETPHLFAPVTYMIWNILQEQTAADTVLIVKIALIGNLLPIHQAERRPAPRQKPVRFVTLKLPRDYPIRRLQPTAPPAALAARQG